MEKGARMPTPASNRPTIRKNTARKGIAVTLLYGTLIVFALFFLLPLAWMFVTSLKPRAEWLLLNWIPQRPTLANFRAILDNPSLPVLRWFLNSAGVATAFTALVLLLDSMAAYAYARMEFRGRNTLFMLLLATLVMPGIIFLVPNYLTIANLGGLNTYWGIIAPGLAGVFGVFFLRQFFMNLPRELEEAALMDGASRWTIFFRIVLPLSVPALTTLGIITYLSSWNDFLWPLLIVGNDTAKQTLPVGLAKLQGAYVFEYGQLMAGAAIAALPVLVLYVILQRYIVRSVAMSGLKG
jgi:multiple sugar transport system permease protein